MMKANVNYLIFLVLLSTFVCATEYPTLTKYVNDYASGLEEWQEQDLTNVVLEVMNATDSQISIIVVNTTNGEGAIMYANKVGEQSGVGRADTDNGIILIYAIGDKEGAIAVGRGIESRLNDAKVGRIGRDCAFNFNQSNYYEGFKCNLYGIGKEAALTPGEIITPKEPLTGIEIGGIIIGIIVLIILFILFPDVMFMILLFGRGGKGKGGFGGGSFGGGGSKF